MNFAFRPSGSGRAQSVTSDLFKFTTVTRLLINSNITLKWVISPLIGEIKSKKLTQHPQDPHSFVPAKVSIKNQ